MIAALANRHLVWFETSAATSTAGHMDMAGGVTHLLSGRVRVGGMWRADNQVGVYGIERIAMAERAGCARQHSSESAGFLSLGVSQSWHIRLHPCRHSSSSIHIGSQSDGGLAFVWRAGPASAWRAGICIQHPGRCCECYRM